MTRKKDSEQKMEIKEILVHENYNNDLYLNDIALLQLVQALELRPFVRTVCLPEEEEGDLAIRDNHGTATGWGVTRALKLGEEHTEEDLSNFLKHASFKIQSDELCRSRTQYLVNSTVTFCAGDGRGKSDACKGDSGGAFVLEAKEDKVNEWYGSPLALLAGEKDVHKRNGTDTTLGCIHLSTGLRKNERTLYKRRQRVVC